MMIMESSDKRYFIPEEDYDGISVCSFDEMDERYGDEYRQWLEKNSNGKRIYPYSQESFSEFLLLEKGIWSVEGLKHCGYEYRIDSHFLFGSNGVVSMCYYGKDKR